MIGQMRDYKIGIDNPGKISTFGGSIEGDESPKTAAMRELVTEETNLKLLIDDFHFLTRDTSRRDVLKDIEIRYFYYVLIGDDELNTMEVYEGAGWAYINSPDDPLLVDSWRKPTRLILQMLPSIVL